MVSSIQSPSGKSIRDIHAKLWKSWMPRFKLDEEFRDLVHQRNIVDTLPESQDRNIEVVEMRSGRAGGIIEHANGLLMARPAFHAEPPSLITTDEREAEQIEKAVANLFERELVVNDFWPAVGRDILIYGRAFLKSMSSLSTWSMQEGFPVREEKEDSKKYLEKIRKWKDTEGKFPFIIQHIPTLSILPMLDNNDNVLTTIEVKYVTAKVLAEEMGSEAVKDALSHRTLKWYDELPVIEYIDTEWVAYALAGTEPRDRGKEEQQLYKGIGKYNLLKVYQHGLGKHPVVMIPGIRTELADYASHFKCNSADEELLLADGRKIVSGELAKSGETFSVLIPNGLKNKALARAEWGEVEPIYEITLESGLKLKRTSHHKFAEVITNVRGGYSTIFKKVSDLCVDDKLAVLNKVSISPQKTLKKGRWITPDLALLLGLLLGDGSLYSKAQTTFTTGSEEILNLFEKTAQRVGQNVNRCGTNNKYVLGINFGREGSKHDKYLNRKKRAPVLYTLEKLNLFGKTSFTKKLPEWSKLLSTGVVKKLLQGLLLADGHIDEHSRIHFTSRSKNLRDWVANISHRLGCPGKVWEYAVEDKPCYKWSGYTEFSSILLKEIGGFPGKNNLDKIKIVDRRRHKKVRRLDNRLHTQKIKTIDILPSEQTVCIMVLEGNEHVYCTPVVEHNSFLSDAKDALEKYDVILSRLTTMVWAYYLPSYEWKLAAPSSQFQGRDRPTLMVNLGGVTVTYCLGVETPILTKDLRWIPAGSLIVGDEILAFEEERKQSNRGRRYTPAVVTCAGKKVTDGYKIQLVNGDFFNATADHKFLTIRHEIVKWLSAEEIYKEYQRPINVAAPPKLVKYLPTWNYQDDYKTGFLAAAFDGEGSLSFCKSTQRGKEYHSLRLSFTQNQNSMLDKVKQFLTELHFEFSEFPHGDTGRIIHLTGGTKEVLRFLGQTRPPRLMEKFNVLAPKLVGTVIQKTEEVAVDTITPVNDIEIAQITTSSKTYFSTGYGSHNSDEQLDTLAIPQNLPDATMLFQACEDIIQRSCLEDVLFGRVQGAAPAYQVNLRINIAKSKLSPLTQHMAIGITQVMDRFLRGIEQLGEAVLIEGERITVKMAKTYRGRLTASIQPKSPVDRSQDIGTALMALQFGLPWDWITENILDIQDPATLRLMNEIQELEQLPPVKERLMQEALEQLEVLVEEDELEDLAGIDLSALPPEFAEAMRGLTEEEGGAGLPALGVAPAPEGGLGRGPFPPGAAPQTLAPRGLQTQNKQPQPGSPLVGEEEIVI